ncbi:MAG TPA: reductive dehalogenase [Anaerolineae bacterium]
MTSNLTRREFLKDMGVLGAGITLKPMFDPETMSPEQLDDSWKPGTSSLRPAWVRTVDKPTTEVNWEQMQRFDERNTCRGGLVKYIGQEKLDAWNKASNAALAKYLKENKPGYTLKDVALQEASGVGSGAQSFLGPPDKDITAPEKRGVSKWTGSPEDAAQVVTAALRHLGAATVGFVELDPKTTEKLIYINDPDGKEMVFADVDQPAEEDKRRIIPRKARWVIVYTVQMSRETMFRSPTILASQTTGLTYTRNRNIQYRLQTFLRTLGYMGLGESSTNALGIAPAFGVMAGLGELSRYNRLLTPEYGPMVRVFKMVTDLPVAPTKPINAGIMEFCKACKICAEACPSKALSMADQPTWEVQGGWNNPGHKAFFENSVKCRDFQRNIAGTNCGICFGVCPYASANKALVHQIAYSLISTVPAANPLIKSMHDLTYGPPDLNGNPMRDPEAWWKMDLPDYGIDTTQGRKDV